MKPIRIFKDERGWWMVITRTDKWFTSRAFETFRRAMAYVDRLVRR
jgi:hypothetical protein